MSSSEFWLVLLSQTLLRAAGWLLLLLLVAPLLKRLSAARRALGWQMAFVGLIFLPLLLLWTPPLPLLHSDRLPAMGMRTPLVRSRSPRITFSLTSRVPQKLRLSARSSAEVSPLSVPSNTITPPPKRAGFVFPRAALPGLLILGWGMGAACFLFRLVAGVATLRRLRQHTVEAPAELCEEARNLANRLGLRQSVTLRLATPKSSLQAPITWGITRPIVLLPAAYGQEPKERCRAALLHELAHIQRRDWAWLLLAQSLCALYWCVPFAWMAARRLNHETELACDDCVLAAGISAPDYATQILEVVRTMQSENSRLTLIAMPMARLPLAEARIRAILDTTRHRQSISWSVLALAALLLAACIPLLSLRVVAAQENRLVRPVASSPVAGLLAPSSSELTAMSLEPHPLTIRRSASQPALSVAPDRTVAALPNDQQPAIAWGPVVNGLQAGLRLVGAHGTAYVRGEPIWQEAYLRNNSAKVVRIEAIGGYESQGAPVITNAQGTRVKVLRFFGEGMMFVTRTVVRPGEIALVGRFAVAFHGPSHPHEVAPGLSFEAEDTAFALGDPGVYSLAQELSPMDAAGKPMKKTVRTGSVSLQINTAPPVVTPPVDHNHIADLATAPIAWGAVHSGLQAGLLYVGERSEYFVGEHVRVAVVLRNVSKAPISFWHETSFALMETPQVTDAAGKSKTVALAPETEWGTVGGIRMTGVTFDMTSAPSADGPAHLHQSEIAPGESILGYCLAGFVLPPRWKDGQAVPGRYHLVQSLRIGLGQEEQLDTLLETGAQDMVVSDPDGTVAIR